MDPPTTRYVDRDGHALAYQVVGDRGVDIVWYLDAGLHLDLMWTDPHIHYLFERTTTFSRSVCFQRRGFGLSDRVDHVPTIEEQADDVLAVMDAVGMEKAILVGIGTACGPLALLAARTPDRVTGVFFHQPFAESLLQTDPVPHGLTPETGVTLVEGWLDAARNWGTGQTLSMWDPAADTTFNRRLMAMMERCSCTPAEARAHFDWFLRLDYSQTLPLVQCPLVAVLVADSPMPEGVVRYVAEQAPRGAFVQLPPSPPGAALGEAWRAVIDAVEELATGSHHPADADRRLASLLFTDMVGSTKLLARIGDSAYRELRATHERQVRAEVQLAGGRLDKVIGDGTFSVFDGPTAAVRCAENICRSAQTLGIDVRAGVHAGAVEQVGPELTGMTVHVGARIGAAAGPGEVLVSRTVRDLVTGSGLTFTDRGCRRLAGVPGRWDLYSLVEGSTGPPTIESKPSTLKAIDRVALRIAKQAPQAVRAVAQFTYARQRHQP